MKARLFLLAILFISLKGVFLSAQENFCPCMETGLENDREKIMAKTYPLSLQADNKRFLTGWTKGNILLVNGQEISDKYLRYDCISDELIWMRESDFKQAKIYKSLVASFMLYQKDGSTMKFVKKKMNENEHFYLQELFHGKLSLYLKHVKKKNNTSNEVYSEEVFYLEKNEQVIKFKPSRRKLVKILGEEKEIKALIRENHLKVRGKNDLTRFFEMYEKLP